MPSLRLAGPLGPLERERARDHADGQRADLVLGDLGDHRRGAGAGAAALAGGHEHHVGALQRLLDVVARLRRGAVTDVRIRAGAEPLGQLVADVQLDVGVAHRERLRVGVAGDELDASQSGVDHPVDGVGAATADADDLDDCQITSAFHEIPSDPRCRVERLKPTCVLAGSLARYGLALREVNAPDGAATIVAEAGTLDKCPRLPLGFG